MKSRQSLESFEMVSTGVRVTYKVDNLQARESNPGAIRIRSRSTSSGVAEGEARDGGAVGGAVGGAAGAAAGGRRPPPLNSVASEPTLPQASVMLAQLLSAQHCQSIRHLLIMSLSAHLPLLGYTSDTRLQVLSKQCQMRTKSI